MSFESFVGARYIRTKQKQAFITLISYLSVAGVAVGVMALIVVISVMQGASAMFRTQLLGAQAHIELRSSSAFLDYENVMETVKNIDGVVGATPFVFTQAMLRSKTATSGAYLKGLDPETANGVISHLKKIPLREKLKAPSPNGTDVQVPGIMLGERLGNQLGVVPGDVIYLISARGSLSPIGHMPSMKRFVVNGLFKTGMYEFDSGLALIHLKDAQKIMRMDGAVTGIEIRTDDADHAARVKQRILSELEFPYWALDWMQRNQSMFGALEMEKRALFVILTLIVLVAAFNIASTLIMMVMSKTKDIAILKAMGATTKSIRKIFVYKGMVIGSVGTSIGTCLGIIVCEVLDRYKFIELPPEIYDLETLPVQLQWPQVLVTVFVALLICYLATLYPAYKASRLNPVEAIRYG